ncbi:FAD binding domain-containing protein [Halocynthiibacter namhaensis]|uniref:FAD binding domain-containing protein n=1 Tax=Halocynthiibacter namhaensis TaxID=1290553 RepID=UPI0005792471|nr:xanthine dehydrogenase family protein subunit M [Halocynthiibacter namhaensis]
MYEFDIEKPSTVEAAVAALADGDNMALAGGQTLIPTLKQRLAAPEKLVSLSGIDSLKHIGMDSGPDGDFWRIGAGMTHAHVALETEDGNFTTLSRVAGNIGDPAVRNRGTIGGSLANNDPSADYPAVVLGLGGTVVTNRREIQSGDYFQGLFETALEEGEIITEVHLPVPEISNYQKFVQPASRFALVGVFVAKFADGVRVAVTGASEDGVFRWSEAETALSGDFSASAVEDLQMEDGHMIEDLHGTRAYRAHLVKVMTRRAIQAAV